MKKIFAETLKTLFLGHFLNFLGPPDLRTLFSQKSGFVTFFRFMTI